MTLVAGVVLQTVAGAGPRVAARLAREPGVTLAGGDGDARVALVWEAADGATLDALAEALLARAPESLGVYPTFVGNDEER
jgi:hypothetical protein